LLVSHLGEPSSIPIKPVGFVLEKVALGLISVGVRGGFTVKQIKLKFQGPSYARTFSKALGGTLLCLILILYFFS
jgi:hypothetical protein